MNRLNERALRAIVLCAAAASMAGCAGAKASFDSAAMAPAAPAAAESVPPPQPLERSVFSRDPNGELSETRLQEILSAPIELDLPARVGLLPVIAAEDWRGPSPDYAPAPPAAAELVKGLRGSEPFSLVSEMMPIPSGALGMEALREVAARYSLRYVILYRESLHERTRNNAWSAGYATLVGALFLPGDTLRVDGYTEASLFDVKTGLLLFTVRRRVSGERRTNVWHTDDKLESLRVGTAAEAAPKLAKDLRLAVHRYAGAVEVEAARRLAGADRANRAQPLPTAAAAH